MKKILFVIGQLGAGGAERVLIDVANNLSNNKEYSITIFTFCKNKLDNQLSRRVNHISLFNINAQSRKISDRILNRIVVTNLFRLLEKISANYIRKIIGTRVKGTYDIEIGFVEGLPIKIVSSSKYIKSSKRIGWIHTDLSRHNHAEKFFGSHSKETETYNNVNSMVFVSEQSKDGYKNYFKEYHKNSFVIPNFIDCDRIRKLSEEKCELNFKYICSVGRLVKEKGFDRLITAYTLLRKEGKLKDVRLVILGSGYEENNLKNLATDLGVVNDVVFIPFTENPYKYIKNSEFFISSSRVEGYSLVVAEAILLEVPVVSTRTGTVSILGESEYGLIVDNTTEGIIEGVKQLTSDIHSFKCRASKGSIEVETINRENMKKVISLIEN
ncbi:glycosyltransferase [Bacillus thuringiensis]|uniref:glycosyltransferase n=1 Tax=Bacillus thuringiensis TaxID=1428 RepID=UPI002AB41F3F|nr:glycosyltransferase [Bacillus thuringiensis]MDY8163760.1 glycosyltransferase [Bacillus thuringiensis]